MAAIKGYWLTIYEADSGAVIAQLKNQPGQERFYPGCPALAIDHLGKFHVAFQEKQSESIVYATDLSGQWEQQIIEPYQLIGQQHSLVIDSGQNAHLAYYFPYQEGVNDSEIRYATNESGVWVSKTVDETYGYSGNASLVLDSNGKAHVSYYRSNKTYYANNVNVFWFKFPVGSSREFSGIAIEPGGDINLAYFDPAADELIHATSSGGLSWTKETVDVAVDPAQYISMVLDSQNHAHISYYDYDNTDLKYATDMTGSWINTAVDTDDDTGTFTSILTDGQDDSHISYYNGSDHSLRYAYQQSASWNLADIDPGGWAIYNSLTLDPDGNPHVTYIRNFLSDVQMQYATREAGTWNWELVDQQVTSAANVEARFDPEIFIYYVDYKQAGNTFTLATNTTGSWTTSPLINAFGHKTIHSMFIDYASGSALLGTSYSIDQTGDDLYRLSYWVGYGGYWTEYPLEEDTAPFGIAMEIDLELYANQQVAGAYLFDTDLYFGTMYAGTWNFETVADNAMDEMDLAMDTAGYAHLVFRDVSNVLPQYVTNKSGQWEITPIDTYPCAYSTILADSDGNAHVMYVAVENKSNLFSMRYATNDTTTGDWETVILDQNGMPGLHTAMALEQNGQIHATYTNDVRGLYYTRFQKGIYAK